jgi:hypothetical protein
MVGASVSLRTLKPDTPVCCGAGGIMVIARQRFRAFGAPWVANNGIRFLRVDSFLRARLCI